MRKRNKRDNDANNKELETAIHLLSTLEKIAFWNLIRSSFVQIVTRKMYDIKMCLFSNPI